MNEYIGLLKLIGVMIVLSLAFYGGCSVQKNVDVAEISELNVDIAKLKQKQAEEKQKYAEQIAKNYMALNQQVAALDKQHTEKEERAKKDFDLTIKRIRSDELKLRERFTCPATPSVSDGGEAGGLQKQDAEFLVSESERADSIVRQLIELQDYVKLIQKQK